MPKNPAMRLPFRNDFETGDRPIDWGLNNLEEVNEILTLRICVGGLSGKFRFPFAPPVNLGLVS